MLMRRVRPTRRSRRRVGVALAASAAAVTVVYAGSNARARSTATAHPIEVKASQPGPATGRARPASRTARAEPKPLRRRRAAPQRKLAGARTKRSASPPPLTFPDGPEILRRSETLPEVHVYPPHRTGAPAPVTVMLHGMCNAPEWECPYFADAVQNTSWLICPRASIRCDGGGAIWSWKNKAETVEAAVARVRARYPGSLDETTGRTLMGFSLGAIAGMDLAHFGAGRWSSVILIGAKVRPNAALLRRSGVKRLLMVAGEYDMMRSDMFQQTRRLRRQGFRSAFFSLGKIGHAFPSDMNDRVARALAWVHGDDTALERSSGG